MKNKVEMASNMAATLLSLYLAVIFFQGIVVVQRIEITWFFAFVAGIFFGRALALCFKKEKNKK